MKTDVLVVGGGLAGLTCATGLRDSGLSVVVVERARRLGGRAASCTDPVTGDVVDVGPHVLLSEYPNLLRLLETLGTGDLVVWDHDQLMTVVDGDRAVAMHSSGLPAPFHLLPSLMRVPSISTRDLLSNHATSWFVMRANEEDLLRLDTMDARTFLREKRVAPRFIDWFWATIAMAIMNLPLEECSAGALMRFYRVLLAHRELRLGFAGVGLAELFAEQARRQIEGAGGRVLTGREVAGVIVEQGAVAGARLTGGERIDCRSCVCAVEPQALNGLLPPALTGPGGPLSELDRFRPSPYISTYLWFDRKLSAHKSWARAWRPDNLNYDFYDLSNIRHGWQARPSVITGNIIYSHRAAHLDDDEVVARTVEEIAEFLPAARTAAIRHARVHRIPMAIPCPVPGLESKRPAPAAPVPGLYLAGDWIDTGLPASMESAVRGGALAAEQVLARAGRTRRLALDVKKTGGMLWLTSWGAKTEAPRHRGGSAPAA